MFDETRTYSDLQVEIGRALRSQHPEWIQPNGASPICDGYEARLAILLRQFARNQDRPTTSLRSLGYTI